MVSDKRTVWWHVHHGVLCEPLTESVENRIAYIKASKPKDEIEIRLKLLKPASKEASKARAVHEKAVSKAWAYEAWAVYDKATSEAWAELERLHRTECPDCPWNGKTIFPVVA